MTVTVGAVTFPDTTKPVAPLPPAPEVLTSQSYVSGVPEEGATHVKSAVVPVISETVIPVGTSQEAGGVILKLYEAIKAGEEVKANHRYIYGEHRLGTWLVGIASANKKKKRLDVREKIEKIGFDYSKTSRDLKSVFARLIQDLYKAENPNIQEWRTRLFKQIDKKEKLNEKTIQEIEFAWKYHFNDDFVWEKIHEKYSDNTDEWKKHRQETGQWYPIKIIEGRYQNLYTWVERRFKKPSILMKDIDKFNETELNEIRNTGFKF